ncbi:hypothetical protein J7443_13600 [Tropicibacter sp. R15_0]|uniref:hypothetical protein n=1 Tax=Tropicibacter sp. R15_0 TaxID=2821101 RepID=UPI001ADBA712|nr:hypothetical protein [Tropicibacter sp. R15_0]MBO9466273.1 hypothetical protein [Tropicibacter sp. R15_0]
MFNLLKKSSKKKVQPIGSVTALGHRAGQTDSRLPPFILEEMEPGHPLVDGPHYHDVLGALHQILRPEWYLEIGTRTGTSLERCLGNFVAIDPEFRLKKYTLGKMEEGHFFQQTSDAFFDSGFLTKNEIKPTLGFLDGMHLSEFLLRDFINFEKHAGPGAVAVLHDCLPLNAAMEDRDTDPADVRMWTGDVWKTLVVLQDLRPDLEISVLDAYPTGLVVVQNLDAENTALQAGYDAFVEKYEKLSLSEFGVETYFNRFEVLSSYKFIEGLASKASQPKTERI